VTLVMLVFGGLGAALFALVALVMPSRPGLVAAVGRFDAGRQPPAGSTPAAAPRGFLEARQLRLGRRLAAELATRGIQLRSRRADLELLGRPWEIFLGRKVLTGIFGLLMAPGLALALAPSGVRLPASLIAALAAVFGAGFFVVPDLAVRQEADRRRRDFRQALGSYLDLVSMSLAGGRGAPQALPEAANIADGWAYRLLGDTIEKARLAGRTPWEELRDLGERVGVPELRDLGSSLTMVANNGAKIRGSLSARATTLRRRQLADAEGRAGEADQSMRLAMALFAFGFLILLGFPAVYSVFTF